MRFTIYILTIDSIGSVTWRYSVGCPRYCFQNVNRRKKYKTLADDIRDRFTLFTNKPQIYLNINRNL